MDDIYRIQNLDNFLKKFNCAQGLIEISELSNLLYNEELAVANFPLSINGKDYHQTVANWGLAFIAYRLICVSSDNCRNEMEYKDLLVANKIFNGLEDPLVRDEDSLSFFLRLAQEQLTWQQFCFPQILARYIYIFKKNQKFGDWFKQFFDLTIDEFVSAGFIIFTYCLLRLKRNVFKLQDLIDYSAPFSVKDVKDMFVPEKIKKFLDLSSAGYLQIRNEARTINKITVPYYERLEFNPLFKYPIIKVDQMSPYFLQFQYIIPNIILLMRKISDGIYWTLRDKFFEENSHDFLGEFGNAFQYYVEDILKLYFPDNKVESVKKYLGIKDNSKENHADWMVFDNNDIYLFECKSSLLPLICRKTFKKEIMEEWIKNNLIKGIDQLENTENMLKKRNLKQNISKFIVIFDDLPLAERQEFKSLLTQDSQSKKLFILNIRELEKMEKHVNKFGFKRILQNKIELENDSGKRKDFLFACEDLDRSLAAKSLFLDKKFKEFYQRYLI